MPTALLIDHGESRAALAGARALAAAGWRVAIGSPTASGLAAMSRRVAGRQPVPGPEHGAAAFVSGLRRAIEREGAEVVIPSDDHQLLALSLHRSAVPALVPLAPHEVVLRSVDKLELHRAAGRVGLGSPRTVEASAEAIAGWPGPAVVKARLHFPMDRAGAPAHLPVRRVANAAQLAAAVTTLTAAGGAPLLQEPVEGRHLSFSAVADHDQRIVTCMQQETMRLFPPGAGISTRAVTVTVDEALAERVQALFAELGWTGLAQLQFRVGADRVPRLIDLNGRLYGSLALALRAGVNLPATWLAVAAGRPVQGPARARAGARYQWLEGDLRAAEGGARGLAGSLAFAVGAGHSVWDVRDPRPGLRIAGRLPSRAARALLARTRRSGRR